MRVEELEAFRKDVKNLLKRYRTLKDDLNEVEKILIKKPAARPPFSYEINNLKIESCVIKVKKIACRALKGRGVNSGLRLVYAYFEMEQKIIFIELYHKSDKENEDRERIMENLG